MGYGGGRPTSYERDCRKDRIAGDTYLEFRNVLSNTEAQYQVTNVSNCMNIYLEPSRLKIRFSRSLKHLPSFTLESPILR